MNMDSLALAAPQRGTMRQCRVCGCSEAEACVDPEHGACWWIEQDLCSHCGEPAIVASAFDRMAAGGRAYDFDRPVSQAELDQFFHWMRRARAALGRVSTSPPETFLL